MGWPLSYCIPTTLDIAAISNIINRMNHMVHSSNTCNSAFLQGGLDAIKYGASKLVFSRGLCMTS